MTGIFKKHLQIKHGGSNADVFTDESGAIQILNQPSWEISRK